MDWFYRNTQPYADMYGAGPASSSLLLDYPASTAVFLSIKAAMNSHWGVSLFSMVSLFSVIPPIFVSSIFAFSQDDGQLHVQPAPFWFLFVLLTLYLVLLFVARPPPAYRLPRMIQSYADVLSYCHSSRILDDLAPDGKPVFSAQDPD